MFTVRHYASLDSTNDEAKRLGAAGAPHGIVIHADEQASGRGRFGRTWFSPPGNLYLSVLLHLDLPPARTPELSFIAALAVADTADTLLPGRTRTRLKWPNDVLVNGAKIAGILVEQIGGHQIIGIGLNILHAPHDSRYKTATLLGAGGLATVDGARDILLDRLAACLGRWTEEGFAPIRIAWLERAHPIGTPLQVRLGNHMEQGHFAGLDTDGALLLDTVAGRRRVVSGEVAEH